MALETGTVRVEDVWESFRTYSDNPTGLRDRLAGRRKRVVKEFWALRACRSISSPVRLWHSSAPMGQESRHCSSAWPGSSSRAAARSQRSVEQPRCWNLVPASMVTSPAGRTST